MVQLFRLAVGRWQQRDERGQTLVEYGLLLSLIAIVVIAVCSSSARLSAASSSR